MSYDGLSNIHALLQGIILFFAHQPNRLFRQTCYCNLVVPPCIACPRSTVCLYSARTSYRTQSIFKGFFSFNSLFTQKTLDIQDFIQFHLVLHVENIDTQLFNRLLLVLYTENSRYSTVSSASGRTPRRKNIRQSTVSSASVRTPSRNH